MNSPDYERGYDKALAEAANSVQIMQRKLENAETLVRAIIRASGGSVFVGRGDIVHAHPDNYDLVQTEDLEMNGWKFSIRRNEH